jgi:hypothetical protein
MGRIFFLLGYLSMPIFLLVVALELPVTIPEYLDSSLIMWALIVFLCGLKWGWKIALFLVLILVGVYYDLLSI